MNESEQEQPQKKSPDLSAQYRASGEELSNRQLRLAAWYVRNRARLWKTTIGLLIAWSVVTVGYSLIVWGHYFFVGYWADQDLLQDQVNQVPNYEALQVLYSAQELVPGTTRVFASSPGKYDFVAQVLNPNERWVAFVEYSYQYAGGQTDTEVAIVLPAGETPFVLAGHEAERFPAQPTLVVHDTQWMRADPHEVPDVAAYMAARLDFSVEEMDFTGAGATGLAHRLEFDLINNSAYSYREPSFYVMLYRTGDLVGVTPISLPAFRSLETHEVDLRLFTRTLAVTDVEVVPQISIFDDTAYLAPGDT